MARIDLDLLGPPGARVRDAAAVAFCHMAIAEEEIKRAQQEHPEKAALLHDAWFCCQSPIVSDAPVVRANTDRGQMLFRIHCRQFLRNLAEGVDVDRPTLIEVAIMLLLGLAHSAPPHPELTWMVEGNAETMHAFGQEPLAPPTPDVGQELWPDLTTAPRAVYRREFDMTRVQLLKRTLKEYQKPRLL